MLAPVILAIVTAIAGHPTTVACDADSNPSPFPTAPGYVVAAWTLTGGDTIHALPLLCNESRYPLGSTEFAAAIETFIHEAARARGVVTDSCAQLTADEGVYDVLRRWYGVPFFSPMSEQVGAQVLSLTRKLPASYQPELCWNSGSYG